MSFLEEMEAFKELKKEEVEKMRRKAEAEGRKIEVLPSKIVTMKPGVGGRKKVTWVVSVCGNPNERRRIRSQEGDMQLLFALHLLQPLGME